MTQMPESIQKARQVPCMPDRTGSQYGCAEMNAEKQHSKARNAVFFIPLKKLSPVAAVREGIPLLLFCRWLVFLILQQIYKAKKQIKDSAQTGLHDVKYCNINRMVIIFIYTASVPQKDSGRQFIYPEDEENEKDSIPGRFGCFAEHHVRNDCIRHG